MKTSDENFRRLSPRAAERNLDLRLRIAPDLPENLHGDPVRLRQVLLNLVGNAIRREPGRGSAGDGFEERLAALKALEETTGQSVVAVFLQQGEADLETLRRALPQGDGKAFSEAAHALAGSSGMVGALGLSRKASELSTLARQGDLRACEARLPALEEAWGFVAGRLKT